MCQNTTARPVPEEESKYDNPNQLRGNTMAPRAVHEEEDADMADMADSSNDLIAME